MTFSTMRRMAAVLDTSIKSKYCSISYADEIGLRIGWEDGYESSIKVGMSSSTKN